MRIEEFIEKINIAIAPDIEQRRTNEDTSAAYSAIQDILKDKESIFIVISILENSQNYPDTIVFLTQSVLYQLLPKMHLPIYTHEMLDHFSKAFYNFIYKFKENASIYSQGIVAFAKVPNYESKYISLIEQLAFERLNMQTSEMFEYDFAVSTLSSLVSLYQNLSINLGTKGPMLEFFDKVKAVTLPYFNLDFKNYSIPTKIISIYSLFEIYAFYIFTNDSSFFDTLLNVLDNAENLQVTESIFNYFRSILNFFMTLFMHCHDNSDNREIRGTILREYSTRILLILPKFCLFLTNLIPIEPNTRFLGGQCFSLIKRFFGFFQSFESYGSVFDSILQSIISFTQLSEDDLSDFMNNIFNYYMTAYVIEKNSNNNARSNSVILLRLMATNEDQKYINHIVEVLLQMGAREEIFFLLANIVDLIKDNQAQEAIRQYINNTFESYQEFPLYIQFSFILLASKSMNFLSDEESGRMLPIAMSFIEESKSDQITPFHRFYFTFASEIIENFLSKYKTLPPEIITSFIELSGLSFSTNTTKLVDSIFKIDPKLFGDYQNFIIQQNISVIHEILTDESDPFLSERQIDLVSCNIESLNCQAQNPNPNFPGQEISACFNECLSHEHCTQFIPEIISLLSSIITKKTNGYDEAINLSVKFFENCDMNYHADTVKPILIFILYGLDAEKCLALLGLAIKKAYSHITSFQTIADDDSIPDLIACTTLISRLIQLLGGELPSEAFESIVQLIGDIRKQRDDMVSNFIIFEIMASLTFVNKGNGMQDEIDKWILLCSSGIIQENYYCSLHSIALKFISETFPDRSSDILPLCEILNKDPQSLTNENAENFIDSYDVLYSYASYKAPFQQ